MTFPAAPGRDRRGLRERHMDQGSATTAVPKIGHIEWGCDDRPCQADDSPFSDDRLPFRLREGQVDFRP